MHHHPSARLIAPIALALATAVATVSPAAADPSVNLADAVNSLRGGSHCPALQADPLVTRVAQMASQNTSDYVGFRTAAVPFTDPMPALAAIGYKGSKGLMLSGHGLTEADALQGVELHYRASKPDCSYSQYGVSALHDDAGFDVTTVVLTAP